MNFGRWYPTAISLGDDSGRVLIVGGAGGGKTRMEVYNEHSGKFSLISGPPGEDPDPSLSPITWDYPNLHLLRNGEIYFSRANRYSDHAHRITTCLNHAVRLADLANQQG